MKILFQLIIHYKKWRWPTKLGPNFKSQKLNPPNAWNNLTLNTLQLCIHVHVHKMRRMANFME